MSDEERHPFLFMRKQFFAGLFFLIPIAVTIWLLDLLIEKTQSYARPLVERALATAFGEKLVVPEIAITSISLVLVIVFVIGIGWLGSFYLGKKVLSLVDAVLLRLPFIRSIYGGTKQILDAFSLQRTGGSFKKVALLEYPRRDSWVLGFITNEDMREAEKLFGKPLIGVFVPSTPNPTTGFLLYLPPSDLHILDIDVEEAVKLIVSAGLVVPERQKKPPITLAQIIAENIPKKN
jgi:uncharacterized membrane protein